MTDDGIITAANGTSTKAGDRTPLFCLESDAGYHLTDEDTAKCWYCCPGYLMGSEKVVSELPFGLKAIIRMDPKE